MHSRCTAADEQQILCQGCAALEGRTRAKPCQSNNQAVLSGAVVRLSSKIKNRDNSVDRCSEGCPGVVVYEATRPVVKDAFKRAARLISWILL